MICFCTLTQKRTFNIFDILLYISHNDVNFFSNNSKFELV